MEKKRLEAGDCRVPLSKMQLHIRKDASDAEPMWACTGITNNISAPVSGNTDAPAMHDFIHVAVEGYPWKKS